MGLNFLEHSIILKFLQITVNFLLQRIMARGKLSKSKFKQLIVFKYRWVRGKFDFFDQAPLNRRQTRQTHISEKLANWGLIWSKVTIFLKQKFAKN